MNIWKRIKSEVDSRKTQQITYSQKGEDIIVYNFLKYEMNKTHISYLDIGANAPKKLNNTYIFYKEGCKGILVEPNSELCKQLKRYRKRDKIYNCGVAVCNNVDIIGKKTMTYYKMDAHTLNSFSKEDVYEFQKLGHKLIATEEIPIITINEIFDKNGKVDFLSIDVEGLDFQILQSINYDRYAPLCICVETQEYMGTKRSDFQELNLFLKRMGYVIYADTMLNTIYVKEKEWIENIEKNFKARVEKGSYDIEENHC